MCLLETFGGVFPLDNWDHLSPFYILFFQQHSQSVVTTLEAVGWDSCYQHGSQVYFTCFLTIPSGMSITSCHSFMQLGHVLLSWAPKPFPEPLLSSHSALRVRLEFLIPGTTSCSKMPFKQALLAELWRLLCMVALCSSLFITLNLFVISAL